MKAATVAASARATTAAAASAPAPDPAPLKEGLEAAVLQGVQVARGVAGTTPSARARRPGSAGSSRPQSAGRSSSRPEPPAKPEGIRVVGAPAAPPGAAGGSSSSTAAGSAPSQAATAPTRRASSRGALPTAPQGPPAAPGPGGPVASPEPRPPEAAARAESGLGAAAESAKAEEGGDVAEEAAAPKRDEGAKKALSGQEVLCEIKSQWTEGVAAAVAGSSAAPSTRYGYVRRERATELAIYGRGLDALDKPEYQNTVTSVQLSYIIVEAVLRDVSRLSKFHGLASLTFSHNQISNFTQLHALRQLPTMQHLTIVDNPICELRSTVNCRHPPPCTSLTLHTLHSVGV